MENQNKKRFLSRKIIIAPVAVIILLIAVWLIFAGGNENQEIIKVSRGTVTQEVAVTGKTKAKDIFELAFERGGKVSRVFAEIGRRVNSGNALVALDASELSADLREAEAFLEEQKARLSELKSGAKPEEISIAQLKIKNAETALADARQNLIDKINDAFTKTDDAVKNYADELFTNAGTSQNQLTASAVNGELKEKAEFERFVMEITFASWKKSLNQLTLTADLEKFTSETRKNLSQARSFLEIMAIITNDLEPNASLSKSSIDRYKANIGTARANISVAIANLSSAEEKQKNAEAGLRVTQEELTLKKSGASPEQIGSQEARIKEAEARKLRIQTQIAKMTLRAPAGGTITKQDAKVGEIIAAGKAIVGLISEANLEIEASIPEVDIGAVSLENIVKITFDALPDEEFSGSVTHIDPAETISEGAVNFKIKVALEKNDARVKSGLTANLKIETLVKKDVLALPQLGILETDKGAIVKKVINGEIKEVPVKLGVKGSDGLAEILSGLSEGDEVINVGTKK